MASELYSVYLHSLKSLETKSCIILVALFFTFHLRITTFTHHYIRTTTCVSQHTLSLHTHHYMRITTYVSTTCVLLHTYHYISKLDVELKPDFHISLKSEAMGDSNIFRRTKLSRHTFSQATISKKSGNICDSSE